MCCLRVTPTVLNCVLMNLASLGFEDLGLLSSKSRLHLWVIHYCVCTLPTWLPRAETACSVLSVLHRSCCVGWRPRPCSVLTGQAPCQHSTEGSKEPSCSYVYTAHCYVSPRSFLQLTFLYYRVYLFKSYLLTIFYKMHLFSLYQFVSTL